MGRGVVILLWLASTVAWAQESTLHADFRRESERAASACDGFSVKALGACGVELFTDHPLHIAAGSMAPQNGFGFGGAFVTSHNTKTWRLSWDLDAVSATSGARRAGGYMKMVHTPNEPVHVIKALVPQPGAATETHEPKPKVAVHSYTVFNLYAQSTSLSKVNFFGLGNDSTLARASVFGMTDTVVGANVIKPLVEWPATSKLNLALLGEMNGRFVDIRGDHGQSVPSIETLYSNRTAPGLSRQPGFFQLGQGLRIQPVVADYLQLNYLANFQEFFAPSSSQNSFLRWTVDLGHTFYLYGYTQSAAPGNRDFNGPDECAPAGGTCSPVPHSRNLNGSVGVRLLLSESINSATSAVPFYFQQTLGGSDINGAAALGSYQDYRFRAPNLLLLEEKFEHSIWGPFGFAFLADQGRVALTRGDLGFSHLKHSLASGITLRAGGFPMVFAMFAWGGSEGHHNIFTMNTELLGGSARPPLD